MSQNMSQPMNKFTVYLIDNYDSFTYNLYQYIGEVLSTAKLNGKIGEFEVIVARNDQVTVADIKTAETDRIIISPGPGSPDDERYFGVCSQVITELGPKIPFGWFIGAKKRHLVGLLVREQLVFSTLDLQKGQSRRALGSCTCFALFFKNHKNK